MANPTCRPRPLVAPISVAIAVLSLLMCVGARNLAWDDADYLRDGLRVANAIRSNWSSRPVEAFEALLRVRPKPPLLVGWITLGGLVEPLRRPSSLLLFASVVPFAALLVGVARVGQVLAGPRAAALALVCVAASPMGLSFGSKVMVETSMGLWVLLTFFFAANLLNRPNQRGAVALGVVLGLACLTKLTAAMILPVPALLTLVLLFRRFGTRRASKLVAWTTAAFLLIAGPWYVENGPEAIRFAGFSSQYNLSALGSSDIVGPAARLAALARDVIGWPLLGAAAVAVVGLASRRPSVISDRGGVAVDYWILAVAGGVSSALILLVPAYFDPRFFLPVWPALAIGCGALLAQGGWDRGRLSAVAIALSLGLGLIQSAGRLASEPRTTTFWAARSLIEDLVKRHGVANIYNVGNCRDWNVSKTGLINELRPNPTDCFVLHDLSGASPEKFLRRLEGAEAVVALDRSSLPSEWFEYGPNLNRNCGPAVAHLLADRRFIRVLDYPSEGLPPLFVFVRRDLQAARANTRLGL